MSTSGRRLLSSLVKSGDVQEFLRLGIGPHLFKESEGLLYELIHGHLSAFGVIPNKSTIENMDGFEDALVDTPEPPAYYMKEVESRYMHTSLKNMVAQAHSLLSDKNPEKALETLLTAVADLNKHKHRNSLFDFRDSAETIYNEYISQWNDNSKSNLHFGWPTLDEMTNGLRGGDLCTFVGRPASGKTFLLLYNAHNAWSRDRVPLFVSMEMKNIIIEQRLAAMHSHKPLKYLLRAEMTKAAMEAMMLELNFAKEKSNPFWIVDGNLTTTIDDIIMLARQLNPSVILVDGAYLLRHPNPKVSKWDRLTDNAEWLKQRVATDLDIPVVCSYQLSREAAKKAKKNGEVSGLEDIYGTDAIGQLSTMVMGLFEDDSPETLVRRKVEILKGRNGETGQFYINWDFMKMDFHEWSEEEETADLQFMG